MLRLLKAHHRQSEIWWWLSADLQELLQDDPDLSGVYLFHRRGWTKPFRWGETFRCIRDIQARCFDIVIDLQGLARSGLMAWIARGELTIGLEDWREGALCLYDQIVPRPSPLTHAVDWYLQVLQNLRVPLHWNFEWLPPRPRAAEKVQQTWKVAGSRWILINPGARWPNKRWPIAHFKELVRDLSRAHTEYRFAVLGGPGDAPLGAAICAGLGKVCLDLTGRTSLSELIEWIRLSELVITNDTGPMHIAAALQKPVVSIFGPTEPRRTGPYRQIERSLRIDLPCAPCLKPACHWIRPVECLRAITPATVCSLVREILRT